jgi:hypothetical protein
MSAQINVEITVLPKDVGKIISEFLPFDELKILF